ncbi:MAG: glutamate 5-kinase [Prolixibacteraceae bacterium]|jgi:glutamate 5-kinase|nr:glutamate 5-kinase [Prolixibacteraceae bacterium]MDI9563002.1 glutamate 5-kinase [Bacteroidota bacterium]NLS98879.1 glutamate 5-kinase [Bacteroidales bacterium]OQB80597.1 MAG: Glutamate 5-kinase [Bacteroidetes bacterium ADurb.Bin123]HNZ68085.1 glutamate 5-kinase [Prolixibacteraceae bacterium]
MELRYKKITVKAGSNLLAKEDGSLNVPRIAHLVDQVAMLHKAGVEVVLVTSGAVASGRAILTPSRKTDAVSARQLWAALGQVKLMNRYSDFFREYGLVCAQVLTTKENFSSRTHYLNMKNCINTLLENRVIPIVNENDTISVTELMFTDNDELSGLMATLAGSEALVILSNVDGVYDSHPSDPEAKLISQITSDPDYETIHISGEMSGFGRGGMKTKLRIARKVAASGIAVHVANGNRDNILLDIMDTATKVPNTYFVPEDKQPSGVKNWIAYSDSFAKAAVIINRGAVAALLSEKAVSLLPVGVIGVEGEFKKGDLLKIVDEDRHFLGVGKAAFGSDKLKRDIPAGHQKPLIHYDYLYLENGK